VLVELSLLQNLNRLDTTSEVTIGDNLNITGTLSLAGTAITKTAAQINGSATTGLAVAVAVAL